MNDGNREPSPLSPPAASPGHGRARIPPLVIGSGVLILVAVGVLLLRHAEARTNQVALRDAPKPVSVVSVTETTFRPSRDYVGTLEPWLKAAVGPQLVSAYVDTVLVRPGAVVRKGDVLATLDCRNANATSQAVAMQARALDAEQQAVAHEASRVQGLLQGGFVSPNEAEQKTAQSAAQQAQLLATRAKLLGSTLEVNDCVLRSPFDGEVATRSADPGAFVRPGAAIVSVVDRSVVRISGDAPEVDFDVVAPGTNVSIHVLSSSKEFVGKVARRAPAADDATRTVRFEIDTPNPDRSIPVGTTAELHIDVGTPVRAMEIPLLAAAVRGAKATLFVVKDGVAHTRVLPVVGERAGRIFVEPALEAGALIVTEGRALLNDGDAVSAQAEPATPAAAVPVSLPPTAGASHPMTNSAEHAALGKPL